MAKFLILLIELCSFTMANYIDVVSQHYMYHSTFSTIYLTKVSQSRTIDCRRTELLISSSSCKTIISSPSSVVDIRLSFERHGVDLQRFNVLSSIVGLSRSEKSERSDEEEHSGEAALLFDCCFRSRPRRVRMIRAKSGSSSAEYSAKEVVGSDFAIGLVSCTLVGMTIGGVECWRYT